MEATERIQISLCNLCALCVSVVDHYLAIAHHRQKEHRGRTELRQTMASIKNNHG
jgi:hypothetical protein